MSQSNHIKSNPPKSSSAEQKVAVFDLDGTITYRDTYIEFLLFCLRKRPVRVLRGGALLLYYCAYKLGFRSNHWLKAKFLGAVAGGLGGERLKSLCEDFSEKTVKTNIKPRAIDELKRLKQKGYVLVLATASFEFYVAQLCDALGMDHLLCTKAELDGGGCITGELDGKNCIGAEKGRQLEELKKECRWLEISRAYSDDKVDLPLFQLARVALVVDPKEATKKVASEKGYTVLLWR